MSKKITYEEFESRRLERYGEVDEVVLLEEWHGLATRCNFTCKIDGYVYENTAANYLQHRCAKCGVRKNAEKRTVFGEIEKICPNCGKSFKCSASPNHSKTFCSKECYEEYNGIEHSDHMHTCVICGKRFRNVYKNAKTCSSECLSKLKQLNNPRKYTEIICDNCGKPFKVSRKTTRNCVHHFCCKECYYDYAKAHPQEIFGERDKKKHEKTHEIRKCEYCGKEFEVYKKREKRFCSDECRIKYNQETQEFNKKKVQTFLERYGMRGFPHAMPNYIKERFFQERDKKYKELCEKSNLDFVKYIDTHKLLVRCRKCGKEFITNNLSYIQYEKIICKECGEEYKFGSIATKVFDLLDEIGIEYKKNDRQIISPKEIDIFIPSLNIGFEINGNFWHSELCGKDRNYHLNKTKTCYEKGVKLIHIYEDEIINHWEIVKSRIISLCGKTPLTIYARKCTVGIIGDKNGIKKFLNENHLQGEANSSVDLGLFHKGQLISVMTFSKERAIYKRKEQDDSYELIRFCSILNTKVIGGFSKLFSYFIEHYHPQTVKTFADVRWSGINPDNTVYSKCGLKFIDVTQPNYWYMHKNDLMHRKHRYNFTKFSILKKHPDLDPNKTEWELMQLLNYNRIWDCGSLKFIWTKKEE